MTPDKMRRLTLAIVLGVLSPFPALVQAADAQCGHNASCKPVQGTGLCTYDS